MKKVAKLYIKDKMGRVTILDDFDIHGKWCEFMGIRDIADMAKQGYELLAVVEGDEAE